MTKTGKRILRALVILLATVGFCNLLCIIPARLAMRKIERAYAGATQITIAQSSMLGDGGNDGSILVHVDDADEIAEFFATLRIRPSFTQLLFLQCMCKGDYHVTVKRRDAMPFEFSIHHCASIRLLGSMGGAPQLTAVSAHQLTLWLSKHGVFETRETVQGFAGYPPQGVGSPDP